MKRGQNLVNLALKKRTNDEKDEQTEPESEPQPSTSFQPDTVSQESGPTVSLLMEKGGNDLSSNDSLDSFTGPFQHSESEPQQGTSAVVDNSGHDFSSDDSVLDPIYQPPASDQNASDPNASSSDVETESQEIPAKASLRLLKREKEAPTKSWMLQHGATRVKCEPPSDGEDSDSQFSHCYFTNQLPPLGNCSVKLENEGTHSTGDPADLLQHLQTGLEELAPPAPAGPAATPVCVKQEPAEAPALTFENLEPAQPNKCTGSALLDRHLGMLNSTEVPDSSDFMPLMTKDEPMSEGEQLQFSGDDTSDSCGQLEPVHMRSSPKSWTQKDMDNALEALRKHNMSLTKASATYGIPSTTLWQRAHRLGIDTPKKEGASKSWSEADLRGALHALRAGAISANKASKAYGIPSSTLYKIARREGIRLAAPFNAAPTAWRRADLERALASIRCGASSVQRAASQYGIPTGTLYGRCKREGIELSRSNPTPWSEDAMGEALEAVRVGQMSINQAAIHYNLPYSSLYGRFKRCKYQIQGQPMSTDVQKSMDVDPQVQHQELQYYQQPLTIEPTPHQPEHHPLQYPYLHHSLHMSEQDGMLQDHYGQAYFGCSSIMTS